MIETSFARLSADVEAFFEVGFELGIEVSDTTYYVATASDIHEEVIEGERNISWDGPLNDSFGEVSFVINSDHSIFGGLADYENTESYDFRSLGGDLVAVVRNDPTKFGPIDSKIDLTAQES